MASDPNLTVTSDLPPVHCQALHDLIWTQTDTPRTFRSNFSHVLKTIGACRSDTSAAKLALAANAIIFSNLANNAMLMSHGTVADPHPDAVMAGKAITAFVRDLLRNVDQQTLDTDPHFSAQLICTTLRLDAQEGQDLTLTGRAQPYCQCLELARSSDRTMTKDFLERLSDPLGETLATERD